MRGIHPDVPVWLTAIDKGLDENAHILPSLGDLSALGDAGVRQVD